MHRKMVHWLARWSWYHEPTNHITGGALLSRFEYRGFRATSQMNVPYLHSAAWVVPVNGAPIRNGAVIVQDDRIVAIGTATELHTRFPEAGLHDHGKAALTPALVNAHTHIELANLAELAETQSGGFIPWVMRLMALRKRRIAEDPQGTAARNASLQECARHSAEGVSVLADIGNSNLALEIMGHFPGTLLSFHEHLGLSEKTLARNLARLESEPKNRLCSGHAPYSTHPALLQALKERARRLGQVLPIHTAEPLSELEFLRSASGPMADFILGYTGMIGVFQPLISPAEGSVHYLDRLGLLDAQTLCVHAVHVSEAELELLAASGAKVCLCPTSNRFLEVGRASAARFLAHGILPALGTDSQASSPGLSLWQEMRLLAEEEPDLDPAQIFAMATLGGAQALGLEEDYGTLSPGRKADILVVPLQEPAPATAEALLQTLVGQQLSAVSRIGEKNHENRANKA